MIYEITHLTKVYGEKTVLDISMLEIKKGAVYALIGPNGAGKTTLFNILGFLEPPTTGRILFRSKPVQFSEPFLQPLRRQVVIIDQHPILFTTTVYKNLGFGLKIRGFLKRDRERIIEESLDLVGMRNFKHAQAHRLSGGETQRIALARAIALFPKVLLCDEPTASVDAENQTAVYNILKQINEEKKTTIIFTTHNRFQLDSLAHMTLFLDCGRLAAISHENFFTAVLSQTGQCLARCKIQDNIEITIPTDRVGKVRILILPEKLKLTGVQTENRAANCFEGSIKQVAEQQGQIRVVIDVGILLTLLMSMEEYKEKQPLVGEKSSVILPPGAIRMI